MNKSDLRKKTEIAFNTMTKLRRDEEVSLTILSKICKTLNADFGDIMDVWLFEYDGEINLSNATTDEVAQVLWMDRSQIKELIDANMFVKTLEYFLREWIKKGDKCLSLYLI